MARTTTVTSDGEEFVLASLTMDQVEEFWDDQRQNEDKDPISMRDRTWKNLLYSLNNAGAGMEMSELKSRINFKQWQELQTAVLKVSHLLRDEEGEPKAATN